MLVHWSAAVLILSTQTTSTKCNPLHCIHREHERVPTLGSRFRITKGARGKIIVIVAMLCSVLQFGNIRSWHTAVMTYRCLMSVVHANWGKEHVWFPTLGSRFRITKGSRGKIIVILAML
jgi:hypothetical protein